MKNVDSNPSYVPDRYTADKDTSGLRCAVNGHNVTQFQGSPWAVDEEYCTVCRKTKWQILRDNARTRDGRKELNP